MAQFRENIFIVSKNYNQRTNIYMVFKGKSKKYKLYLQQNMATI